MSYKGTLPWNTGKKHSVETRAKIGAAMKGRTPWNVGRNNGNRRGWKPRSHVVWEDANGPIPQGYLIHHDNEIRSDNRLENLRCITRAEHNRIHRQRELAAGRGHWMNRRKVVA
jgi:hypothetical protein